MINTFKLSWIATIALIFLGCRSSESNENLYGHWHGVENESYFQTIEIGDSLISTNEYVFESGLKSEYPLINKQGLYILPLELYLFTDSFHFVGDTLFIGDSTTIYKYVRSDLNRCLITDRYINSEVKIDLETSNSAEKFEISLDSYCSDNIFIGKMKGGNPHFDSLAVVLPDSIYIQAQGVMISHADIPRLAGILKDLCANLNKPLNVNLHADKSVPDSSLYRVANLFSDSISVHRIVIAEDGDIGLIKFR